jgi:hypothetical protein
VCQVFPKSDAIRDVLMSIVTTNTLFSSYAVEEQSTTP